MSDTISPLLEDLIDQLHHLPGIGKKTAQRLALHLLRTPEEYANNLTRAILKVKQDIHFCTRCFNITEHEFCSICNDPKRDNATICVVEDIVDIFAIEKTNEYKGYYHVLGGVISPLAGILPADLKIKELLQRAENPEVKEILMALNPSTEGEATMIYLSNAIKPMGKKITRIASGIPLGAHLEFIDDATIGRAILGRSEL
jgi:recombination protein RecR